jgi:uncharacterized membrane protein
MDNKKLGVMFVIIGFVLLSSSLLFYLKEEVMIQKVIAQTGTCYLEDGTCLHETKTIIPFIITGIISAILAALGIYLLVFDKSQKEIIKVLEKQKHVQKDEEKFSILLKGLDEDEQKIIKAVKEQDGITQNTLRLRADMHKSKLSIVLKNLEKKGLVTKIDKGKTKQIFLRINI